MEMTPAPKPPAVIPNLKQRLFWHLNANAIGDYYDIQPLCDLARSKIKNEFEGTWCSVAFLYLLEEACANRKTGDDEFFRLLGHIAAYHQEDLARFDELKELDIPLAFFMRFVSSSVERVRKLEQTARDLARIINPVSDFSGRRGRRH
jgi:hypothetical protein